MGGAVLRARSAREINELTCRKLEANIPRELLRIANWLAARKRAESALQAARVKLADASSSRIGLEHECSTARGHWRAVRVDVERLRLLAESMKGDTHES